MTQPVRIGLVVNPIAGMGGAVGLKGTDGPDALRRARALGAVPRAPRRVVRALRALAPLRERVSILVCAGAMGEDEARDAGLAPTTVAAAPAETTADDTRRCARALVDAGVDLLLFAGGDGTARDLVAAIGEDVVTLGIPAGVKIQSAAYAVSPEAAGALAADLAAGRPLRDELAEVVDVDEDALRRDEVRARLYGYLRVPGRASLQGPKRGSPNGARDEQAAIATAVLARMEPGARYVLGPGTTTAAVTTALGIEGTLLGVDVVQDGRLLARDVAEQELLGLVRAEPAWIVVSPIGGQGFLFGRGNQQVGARVIEAVGPHRVIAIASPAKLAALRGRPLRADTDDPSLDRRLSGWMRVVTGIDQEAVYRLCSA